MKILQINKFFFLKGGSERYFFDLSELLSQKKHQVIAWSTENMKNFPYNNEDLFAEYSDFSRKEGFKKDLKKVIRIFWNREAKKKLEKLIKKENPDIAHLHNIFSHFSPSIISTLKKHNIPVVMTLHDYKIMCPNYKFFSENEICFKCLKNNNFRSCLKRKCIDNSKSKSLIGYLEGVWQKNFLKTADKIDIFIAPSLFIKRKAVQSGIPANKVVHLPNFVNEEFSDTKELEKSNLKYMLHFGRLSSEKGIDLLINTYLKNDIKMDLKIVGDGPEEKRLKELTRNCDQIKFLGKKKGKELRELIYNAYISVMPSVWPENLPYSILESLTLKTPVLASKIGGMTEMIKDKETGLLFKLNDSDDLAEKLNWAIDNPKEIKKMKETAREESLEKYNPEKHYNKLIKTYERIKNN